MSKSKERNAVNELEIIGDHSTEVSSVYWRGLWLSVGEEGPSCRGHECGLAALLLVHLLHILTPRIFGHSAHTGEKENHVNGDLTIIL